MASLLGWAKKQVQGIEHAVTHNPVTDAIGNAEQAVAHAVPQVAHFVQPAIQQAASFSNPIQDAQRIGSVLTHVAPHIPTFSNTSPLRFANNAVINPIKTTDIHVGQALQGHNPYNGSVKQQFGQAGQDAINIASVLPIGKGTQLLTKGGKVLPRVVTGAKGGLKIGSSFGAAQGLSTAAQNNLNLPDTIKTIAVNTGVAGVGGLALGGGLPAVGAGTKAAVKFGKDHPVTNEVGAVGKNVNPKPDKNAKMPSDFLKPGVPKLPSEFNPKVTARLTQTAPKDLGASKNPLVGQVEVPKATDAGQAHLNAQFVAGHEQRVGRAAQTELAKLSTKDQNLMRGIQINGVKKLAPKAENPKQFVKTEQALRNYYNLRHAYDHSLGIPTPYRKNYLRDIIPKPEMPGTFEAKGGNLRPGYTQAKTQPGATPVAEGLAKDIAGSSFNHAKLTYAKGLEEAYPNEISRGAPIVNASGVTQQLTTPYGNELFATKDLANKINERGISHPATGALGKYDTVNAFMKYVKLSGGAFHAFTEAGNFAGQQLMSGKLFTEPGSMGKVFKTFLSPKALDKEVTTFRANGTFDKAELSGLTWTPQDIKADVSLTPHGAVAKYTGIKALHDATFQRELPYIKLKTFEQKTQGLDIHNPEDLAKMRSIARGINSEIGGQNRLLEGSLSPKQARVTARFLLATDFTEGKIRTVLAALSKGGEEGKLAREVVAGKALVFAGLATGGAALSGNLKDKSPTQIAQTVLKNFADPSWTSGKNTVSLPATHISEFTKPFKSFVDGNKDRFYGVKHYASSRLAALPSEATQLANNLDYTGNHIYGKNTKKNGGKPISGSQTAVNVAKGVLPIPFGQAASAVQGKQSLPATAGNIAGLRVYPTPPQKSTTPKLTKTQANANAPDRQAAWEHFTAKAKKNISLNNPDLYIARQQGEVQKEQAQGQTTKAFKDQRDINKLQITRNYDKNLVGAYGLNATDFKAFVNQASQDDINKLYELDNKLVSAGLVAKSKFPKTKASSSGASRVASSRSGSKGGTRSSSGRVSKGGKFTVPKTNIKKIATPKGIKVKKLTSSTAKTRKLSVSKIPTQYKGKKLI